MKLAYSYVRWSSDKQSLGDSDRRQYEKAVAYASQHSLQLADVRYTDSGVSAFKGRNASEGALKAFLDAVDAGTVRKDAVLMVESLDRISRLPVMEALRLFQDIIGRGIEIATLDDGQRYSTARINENWTSLIIALSVMSRANEESKTKSVRVKAKWDEKRKQGGILTAMAPPWLQPDTNRKKWVVIKEQADKVKLAFKLAMKGHGTPTIARMLNEQGVKALVGSPEKRDPRGKVIREANDQWSNGTVAHVLKNRATIGTFIPKKLENGLPVENYYPAIVDENIFWAVQDGLKARKWKSGLKEHDPVTNLFTGLCYCHCGARMKLVSSSAPNNYLRCTTAYSGGNCTGERHPYRDTKFSGLEREVLLYFTALDMPYVHLLAKPGAADKTVLQGQLDRKQEQLEAMVELMKAGSRRGAHEVVKLESEIDALTEQLRQYEVPGKQSAWDAFGESIVLLQEMNREKDAKKKAEMRLLIRSSMQRMVERIVFYDGVLERDDSLLGKGEFRRVTVQIKDGEPQELFYPLPKWGFGRKRN